MCVCIHCTCLLHLRKVVGRVAVQHHAAHLDEGELLSVWVVAACVLGSVLCVCFCLCVFVGWWRAFWGQW